MLGVELNAEQLGTDEDFYKEVMRVCVKRQTNLSGKVSFWEAVKRAEALIDLGPQTVEIFFKARGEEIGISS